jgi:hypothetical protein
VTAEAEADLIEILRKAAQTCVENNSLNPNFINELNQSSRLSQMLKNSNQTRNFYNKLFYNFIA